MSTKFYRNEVLHVAAQLMPDLLTVTENRPGVDANKKAAEIAVRVAKALLAAVDADPEVTL